MILLLNLETSDLIKPELPLSDPAQPWIVEVAASMHDRDLTTTYGRFQTRVRADGRKIRPGAEKVHGISNRAAGRYGMSEIRMLGALTGLVDQCEAVVGFGLNGFDKKVVESVLIRQGKKTASWTRAGLEFIDIIGCCAQACRLQGNHESNTYRWPTLDQACEILLGEAPQPGIHDAWDDLGRAGRLYKFLRDSGRLGCDERDRMPGGKK